MRKQDHMGYDVLHQQDTVPWHGNLKKHTLSAANCTKAHMTVQFINLPAMSQVSFGNAHYCLQWQVLQTHFPRTTYEQLRLAADNLIKNGSRQALCASGCSAGLPVDEWVF